MFNFITVADVERYGLACITYAINFCNLKSDVDVGYAMMVTHINHLFYVFRFLTRSKVLLMALILFYFPIVVKIPFRYHMSPSWVLIM